MDRVAAPDLVQLLVEDIAALRERRDGQPLIVGICGAQGSGKTTLCANLQLALARQLSARVAVLSIDDFYLSAMERMRLSETVHPLLRTRGAPGTHEVALGLELLDRLTQAGTESSTLLPRFDKLADDRAPRSTWPAFSGRADVVLLEGWCVGARAQPEEQLIAPINALERDEDPDGRWRRYVNAQLAGPYQALFGRLDRLVLLRAPDFDVVFRWRRQQEQTLAASAGAGGLPEGARVMSDAQLERFISHYERLTRFILAEMPERADLAIALDAQRRVGEVSARA